jgi:hypothetical protein
MQCIEGVGTHLFLHPACQQLLLGTKHQLAPRQWRKCSHPASPPPPRLGSRAVQARQPTHCQPCSAHLQDTAFACVGACWVTQWAVLQDACPNTFEDEPGKMDGNAGWWADRGRAGSQPSLNAFCRPTPSLAAWPPHLSPSPLPHTAQPAAAAPRGLVASAPHGKRWGVESGST